MAPYRAVVMDTFFYHSLGSYSFDARCEIASEIGYDGIYFTLWSEPSWADVPLFSTVRERFGIDAAGLYAAVGGPDDTDNIARVADLLGRLEGVSDIDLAVLGSPGAKHTSDPNGDDDVLRMLERFLHVAERRGITISLYPHTFCWLERTEDAMRLSQRLGHPNLKVVFSGHHWYVADGKNPASLLRDAVPYLNSVNLSGSRRVPSDNGMAASSELIDQGELDNFYLLGLLKKYGYEGSVALQGFSVGGDVYPKLKRTLEAFRDMERRIERHPNWVELRDDPLPKATGAE